MRNVNQTIITEFILLGLRSPQNLKVLLFIMFLSLYIITLCANILIIALVLGSQKLQSPMYFFLSNLSLCDILLCTDVIPTLLSTIIRDHITVSVTDCITQYYFSGVLTACECWLLTVMSYDRYLAICNPLHYNSIMSIKLCVCLMISSYFLVIVSSMLYVFPMYFLQFCGNNAFDHIYCDLVPLLEVSCTDTSIMEIGATILSVPVVIGPFLFIITTYVIIFHAILKISSTIGRQKAFSTCSSHLTVVSTFYGILLTKFTAPSKGPSLHFIKFISILYTVVTPLFNPIIYSLRNQEIRTLLSKWISITRIIQSFHIHLT